MIMKRVKLLTSYFPYGVGEPFLEQEVLYWAKRSQDIQLEIMPFKKTSCQRKIPKKVLLNELYAFDVNYLYILKLMTFGFFWNELTYLLKSRKFSLKNLLRLIKYGILIIQAYTRLEKVGGQPDYYYSYWSNFSSYAALLMKEKQELKVVTRIHRHDLYEYLYDKNYMPFKRQFIHKYDKIYVLSEEGVNYLKATFGVDEKKIIAMPLGVSVSEIKKTINKNNMDSIRIVSVSNIIQIKRIDKIIDAISTLAQKIGTSIVWHHYGDGELMNKILKYASQKLEELKNVQYTFKGAVKNDELQNLLACEDYDLIINSSESEGVPVSLMEAMAKKIVPIAPDVGGIKFLINNKNGYLLSNNCTVDEIYLSIINYLELSDNEQKYLRSAAYNIVNSDYNSDRNYNNFIEYFIK